jgi:hypothetical protein
VAQAATGTRAAINSDRIEETRMAVPTGKTQARSAARWITGLAGESRSSVDSRDSGG